MQPFRLDNVAQHGENSPLASSHPISSVVAKRDTTFPEGRGSFRERGRYRESPKPHVFWPRTWLVLATLFLVSLLSLCLPGSSVAARYMWELDGSVGYLFVSQAKGTPWFSDSEFPSVGLGAGGEGWAMGLSLDHARNSDSYEGHVPGYADTLEWIEKKLSNTCLRVYARVFPGGRQRAVAPYLSLGVGPAVTSVTYTGEATSREEADSIVRLCYAVSVGSKLRFGRSPFSAFFEGSFGGLGALPAVDEDASAAAPRRALSFVSVAAGLGLTFR